MRALPQHRFNKVETLAHGGLHLAAMHFVEGMNHLSHWTSLSRPNSQSWLRGMASSDVVDRAYPCPLCPRKAAFLQSSTRNSIAMPRQLRVRLQRDDLCPSTPERAPRI